MAGYYPHINLYKSQLEQWQKLAQFNEQQRLKAAPQGVCGAIGAAQLAPPVDSPSGVVAMIEQAHQELTDLSFAFSNLRGKLEPLFEPYPEACAAACESQSCEAAAIAQLRMLIGRIADMALEIRCLTGALRI